MPSSRRSTTASSPELVDDPRGAGGVDEHLRVERARVAVRQRVVAEHRAGSMSAGGSNAARLPDVDVALDPIDPERSGRVPVAVAPDDVPVAEAVHDAVRLERGASRPGSVNATGDASRPRRRDQRAPA